MTRRLLYSFIFLLCVGAFAFTEGDYRQAASRWLEGNPLLGGQKVEISAVVPLTDDDGRTIPLVAVQLEPEGYVTMATDSALPPVLGYVPRGRVADMSRDNTGRAFVTATGRHYASLLGTRGGSERNRAEWSRLLSATRGEPIEPAESQIVVAPMMGMTWTQTSPYNLFAPCDSSNDLNRALTGCVATATGQLMAYYQWPPWGTGVKTYEPSEGLTGKFNADLTLPYAWEDIEDDYEETTTDELTEADIAVGRLLSDLDVVFRVQFGYDETSAISNSWIYYKAYEDFHYAEMTNDDFIDIDTKGKAAVDEAIYSEVVTHGRPAYIGMEGHAFLTEGMALIGGTRYYYLNYGWGGYCNGWYTLDSGYEASVVRMVLTNFVPLKKAIVEPLPVESSGEFTLKWHFPRHAGASAFRVVMVRDGGMTRKVEEVQTVTIEDGEARQAVLTGLEDGGWTISVEAKVDGEWCAASDGVSTRVCANPSPSLAISCDGELKIIAGTASAELPFATSVDMASAEVDSSRPDIFPDGSLQLSAAGKSGTLTLKPASGFLGNVLVWLTVRDASGNVARKQIVVRVCKEKLTWLTDLEAAKSQALAENKLVYMVVGRDTCSNTSYLRNVIAEDDRIKPIIQECYIPVYVNVDGTDKSFWDYTVSGGNTLPFTSIFEGDDSTCIRGYNGPETVDIAYDVLYVENVIFSPGDGTTFPTGETLDVSISCLYPLSKIYYREDGVAPTTADTLVESPLHLTEGKTITAQAFLTGVQGNPRALGEPLTATYRQLPQVASPALSTGNLAVYYYIGSTTVQASCETAGAVLRYTVDGTEPTASSAVMEGGALDITSDCTLKVCAFKEGMMPSEIASVEFKLSEEVAGAGVAVGDSDLVFYSHGDALWSVVTDKASSAPSSLKSGVLPDGYLKYSELVLKTSGPGTLDFKLARSIITWYCPEPEAYCCVAILIDGVFQERFMWEVDWQSKNYEIQGEGEHFIVWRYEMVYTSWGDQYNEEYGTDYQHCAWVDDVRWTRTITHTLTVNDGSGDGVYVEGETVTAEADEIPGKVFTHWTAEGMTLGDEQALSPTITFALMGDVTLTAHHEDERLALGTTEKSMSATAGTFALDVLSNTEWTAVASADWLSLDKNGGQGDGSLQVRCTENTGRNRTATITVSLSNDAAKSAVCTVTQAGLVQDAVIELASGWNFLALPLTLAENGDFSETLLSLHPLKYAGKRWMYAVPSEFQAGLPCWIFSATARKIDITGFAKPSLEPVVEQSLVWTPYGCTQDQALPDGVEAWIWEEDGYYRRVEEPGTLVAGKAYFLIER